MGDEFYERPPEKNARYARTLARNSSEEITKFEKLYVAIQEDLTELQKKIDALDQRYEEDDGIVTKKTM